MGRQVTRDLPVKLTVAEAQRRGIELAEALQAKYDAEAHQTAIKATWKEELAQLEQDIRRLRRIVGNGEELRPVECSEEKNWKNKTVETVRLDTGEMVDFRPMSTHELQADLDFSPGGGDAQ